MCDKATKCQGCLGYPAALRKRFLLIGLLVCFSDPAARCCQAQFLDVDQQALESRQRLAAAIAAVDGKLLRAQLRHATAAAELQHWYAGEVKVDGQWLSLTAAEQRSHGNQELASYRQLRQQASHNLADHQRLARWCHKRGLPDQAMVHWLFVLRFDSTHKPALEALGLTWHQGLLLTQDEARQYKRRERELLREKQEWQGKIKRLRVGLENKDPDVANAARQALLEIKAPAAVPAMLDEFAKPAKTVAATVARDSHVIAALGGIDSELAVEVLAQTAVEAPDQPLRYAAIDQLKSKPLQRYVPALLAGMAMPIDRSVAIQTNGSRVATNYAYSQQQPGGRELTERRSAYQFVEGPRYRAVPLYRTGSYVPKRTGKDQTIQVPKIPGHGHGLVEYTVSGICTNGNPFTQTRRRRVYGAEYLKDVTIKGRTTGGYYEQHFSGYGHLEDPAFAQRQQVAVQKSQAIAKKDQALLQERNAAIAEQNERIASVLSEVTGERLDAFPNSWWNWWSNYLDTHPTAATAGTRRQLNAALLNQQTRGLARGTWVWTQQGQRAVETVLPGDYMLSQHPTTGELAYKVVLAIAAPQPLLVSVVETGESQLHCAPGHVAWVTGTGWQRISKLQPEQSLHGAVAESTISSVRPAFEIESYDLIVDDFHTFFAGKVGVLVHDATPIGPTHVALPGFSPAAVAQAVRLAATTE